MNKEEREKRIKEIEKNLKKYQVSKSKDPYDFSSFRELCTFLHISLREKYSSGEKAALEAQFKRFFDWKVVSGRKIKITDTFYSSPKAYKTKHAGVHTTNLNKAIMNLILLDKELIGKKLSLTSCTKHIGIFHDDTLSEKGSDERVRGTYWLYRRKINDGFASALTQLNKAGLISNSKEYVGQGEKGDYYLTSAEVKLYKEIYAYALGLYHAGNYLDIERRGKKISDKFWSKLNKACDKGLKCTYITCEIWISKGPKYNFISIINQMYDEYGYTASEKKAAKKKPLKKQIQELRTKAEDQMWQAIYDSLARKHHDHTGTFDVANFKKDLEEIRKA